MRGSTGALLSGKTISRASYFLMVRKRAMLGFSRVSMTHRSRSVRKSQMRCLFVDTTNGSTPPPLGGMPRFAAFPPTSRRSIAVPLRFLKQARDSPEGAGTRSSKLCTLRGSSCTMRRALLRRTPTSCTITSPSRFHTAGTASSVRCTNHQKMPRSGRSQVTVVFTPRSRALRAAQPQRGKAAPQRSLSGGSGRRGAPRQRQGRSLRNSRRSLQPSWRPTSTSCVASNRMTRSFPTTPGSKHATARA